MKILVVEPGPGFSVQDVANGWTVGLGHAGAEVRVYRLGDRFMYHGVALENTHQFDHLDPVEFGKMTAQLAAEGVLSACMEWWPDVVLIVSGFFVPAKTMRILREHGIRVVLHLTESPYEDAYQYAMAGHADTVLINDPTNLAEFRKVNPDSHYQPHGWNPDIHYPRDPTPDAMSDFVFVGTGYPSRIQWLEEVDWAGIDVALAGNWEGLADDSPLRKFVAHDLDRCVDNDETAVLYSNTLASLNLYRTEALHDTQAEGWAVGPRELELAAIGTFFLRQTRPESDILFPMLPTVDDPHDFGRKLRWWIHHPAERWAAELEASEAVQTLSYDVHAMALLERLT